MKRISKTQSAEKLFAGMEQLWDSMIKDRMERGTNLSRSHNTKLQLESKLILNELSGGKCPMCNKEWTKVDVSPFGFYYRPSCNCFGHCPYCKRSTWNYTIYEKEYLDKENNELYPCCRRIKDPQIRYEKLTRRQ